MTKWGRFVVGLRKGLLILGFLLSFVGALLVHRSLKPMDTITVREYQEGKFIKTPVVGMDEKLGRFGFGFLVAGFSLQLLSVVLPVVKEKRARKHCKGIKK